MEKLTGKSIYGGIAVAKIRYYDKSARRVERCEREDAGAELARYETAKAHAAKQLTALYERALREAGSETAAIFEAHRMLLEDGEYDATVRRVVTQQRVNAEYAVASAGAQFVQTFSRMEDEYLRARAEDIRDISERILANLQGEAAASEVQSAADPGGDLESVILVARTLAPSDMLRMHHDRLAAIVTEEGSANSHTAILARNMEIPVLVGIPPRREWDGRTALVDGYNGILYVDPAEALLSRMGERMREEQDREAALQQFKGKETVTRDGRRIRLCANSGNVADTAVALANDAEGIGLFRSEFLYLEREDFPAEEEQFQVYCHVLEAMEGRPVTFRTMDLGADKQAAYLPLGPEENPAMGFRGIRVCLKRQDIFKTQLRALFRAAYYGDLSVMYPMIIAVDEVVQIRRIVEEVREQLEESGAAFRIPEQGIMIETPAAVMISDILAEYVDFFSIGTNDLTQYALAIDRQNERLEDFYDPRHEAVLRMIETTVRNAHSHGKRVGICGELGADLELTEWFLKLGVDELSVAPAMVLKVREKVRGLGS